MKTPHGASGGTSHPPLWRMIGKEGPMAEEYTGEAYCVKCRAKREFDGTVVELKNGRKAAQGICPVCGTKVMRILGKSA